MKNFGENGRYTWWLHDDRVGFGCSIFVVFFVVFGICFLSMFNKNKDTPPTNLPKPTAPRSLQHQLFEFRLVEGNFISDDYYITNKTTHKLQDVDITFTAMGINGESKSLKQYWAVWEAGEEKKSSAKLSDGQTVTKIQKIQVTGISKSSTPQYSWDFVIYFKK